MLAGLRAARGSCDPTSRSTRKRVLDYLRPDRWSRSRADDFHFTRELDAGAGGPDRRPRAPRPTRLGRQLNLPPAYLLIHRVTSARSACCASSTPPAPYRGVLEKWLPGFAA